MTWLKSAAAAKALGIETSALRTRAARDPSIRKPDPDRPREHLYRVDDGDSRTANGKPGDHSPGRVETISPGTYFLRTDADTLREAVRRARAVDVPQPAAELDAFEAAMRQMVEPANEDEDEPPADTFTEDTVEIDTSPTPPDRPWSIAWISDVHVPEHDVAAVNAWLKWVRDVKPDEIILGGDIAEMGSCSEHGGVANPLSLLDDVKALRSFLLDVRAAAPAARLTFLEGNHCTRFKRIVVHKLPTWNGALDIPSLCDFKGLGISWHEYGKLVQRGKLRFTHGAYANEHHAANHLRRFGCSLVYGHTHRGQTFTRATADMEMQAAFGMPSMRSLQPEWLGGAPSGWGHGFGFFLVLPDGSFTAYTPFITRGRFTWTNGKVYDGNAA